MQPIKVILNPYANRGGGARYRERILRAFAKVGAAVALVETAGQGHARELAQSAHEAGYDIIVAAGGDGTINEVVNGLSLAAGAAVEEAAPNADGAHQSSNATIGTLALLPIGGGNDFAHVLGYPRDVVAVARLIVAGNTRLIDLAQLTFWQRGERVDRYYINSLGIGLEAHVGAESDRITWLRGPLRYVLAALRGLQRYTPIQIAITGQTPQDAAFQFTGEALMVTVGNSPRTGGGFYLTPDAQVDDGWLDVLIARGMSPWRALQLMPSTRVGSHVDHPSVIMMRSCQLAITCPSGCGIHTDGEVLADAADRLAISVLPRRLAVIAPSGIMG